MLDPLRLRRGVPLLLPPIGLGVAITAGTAGVVVLLATVFVAAHAFTIPDREGRRLSLSPMVAIAALMVDHGALLEILPAAAIGMPIGWWLVRTRHGRRSLDRLVPAEPIALVSAAVVYTTLHESFALGDTLDATLFHAVVVAAASFAWYLTAAIVRVLISGRRHRTSTRMLWWEVLREGPAYAALFSGGAMFGFAWPFMSWWAVPLALLSYGFSHLSFNRVAVTRHTYRQTITALGRIPEAGGLVGHGRSERTADLAVAVAGEVRLAPSEVERVEYAGLLHDVGRVVFNDPSVASGGYTDTDVAAWGAEIIQESPSLSRVAELVADQYEPYRRSGEARNDLVPRSAQVVRVAAAYDRSVHESGRTPAEALEELHRGAAYDFDPEVVAALRRVLQGRDVPGA